MLPQVPRQHWPARGATICLAFAIFAAAIPLRVSAQEQESSAVAEVVKGVAFDPTTYAPVVIAYYASVRDWNTSQPLFEHGMVEMNPRFTVSGLPNDKPISYADGKRQIFRDAFLNIEVSAVSNAAEQVVERMLVKRYPDHRKLVRGLGWVQRIALSSYISYQLSIQHFRQAQINERMALKF